MAVLSWNPAMWDVKFMEWVRLEGPRGVTGATPCSSRAISGHRAQDCVHVALACPREETAAPSGNHPYTRNICSVPKNLFLFAWFWLESPNCLKCPRKARGWYKVFFSDSKGSRLSLPAESPGGRHGRCNVSSHEGQP